MKKQQTNPEEEQKTIECFVIMPIADTDGYTQDHFRHVYDDIIVPACENAGFAPNRADEVKQSNLIHLDILKKLLNAPMAVCDLSSHNPNVLFELALRQAFDKPVALIQEVGTKSIFDIAPLRYTNYRKERIYHEVLEDQELISNAIKETFASHSKGNDIQSIVKLLSLTEPANLANKSDLSDNNTMQQLILAELASLREEVRVSRQIYKSNRNINFGKQEGNVSFSMRVMRNKVVNFLTENSCNTVDNKSLGHIFVLNDLKKELKHIITNSNNLEELKFALELLELLYNYENTMNIKPVQVNTDTD